MPASTLALPTVQEVQSLYDENRFLDAYRATRDAWQEAGIVDELDPREMVLAARLAGRLGSEKMARALCRRARELAPGDASVRYFTRDFARRRRSFFDSLREFEDAPLLGSSEPGLEACWCASHAVALSYARDFDRARERLDEARSFGTEEAWLDACEAELHYQQGEWERALACAERAWERSPGMPYVAYLLGASLAALGRTSEAACRLLAWSLESGQSFEVLEQAMVHAFAAVERGEREVLAIAGDGLHTISGRLLEFAPLADRKLRRGFACMRAEAAKLEGRCQELLAHAREARTPFYDRVAESLTENPDGPRRLLPHSKVRQQYKTCLPASLVTSASVFGVELDQEKLASRMTYDGTPMWRALEWAEENGWTARPFTADRESCVRLVEAGIPFLFLLRSLSYAHAVAAVGVDLGMGTLIFHDPSASRLGEILLDEVEQGEAPLGPESLALAPPERAAELRSVTLSGEAFALAFLEVSRAMETESLAAAVSIVESHLRDDPDGAGSTYLRAWIAEQSGNSKEAVQLLKGLLPEHQDCHLIQRLILAAAASSGDTGYYRTLLESAVKRERLPGTTLNAEWIYPEPPLVARYAALLMQSAEHRDEAEKCLEKALYRGPFQGETYHYLGNLLWSRGAKKEALLPYRLASCLEAENDSLASTYAWALKKNGRAREGIAWLRGRAGEATGDAGGGSAWIILAQTLEEFGFPGQSLECLEEGIRRRPADVALATHAVALLARFGKFDEAARALEQCREHGTRGDYLAAATELAACRGKLEESLEYASAWVAERPRSAAARQRLLYLLNTLEGPGAARARLSAWSAEQPDDEFVQGLLLEHLEDQNDRPARREILRHRVERNPLDAWAWRELAWDELEEVRKLPAGELAAALERLEPLVRECVRTGPEVPATLGLQAEVAVLEGNRDRGIELFLQALVHEPGYNYAIQRILELAEGCSMKERRGIVASLDRAFATAVRDLAAAKVAAMGIARAIDRDAALEALERWSELSPDDPQVVEAWADIHIYHGAGRPSAETVLPRLEEMTQRFPLQRGLGLSLADAYRTLDRLDDATVAYRRVLDTAPACTQARLALADCLVRSGREEEALAQLRRGLECDPGNPSLWLDLARALHGRGEEAEALELLAGAVQKMPAVMNLWEARIQLLLETGRGEAAVGVAEELTHRFPGGAYTFLVLARTRRDAGAKVPRQRIEEAFRTAIRLNARLWEAVWEYSVFLSDQGDLDGAEAVIRQYLKLAEDDTYARGGLCCLDWRRGRRREAIGEMRRLLAERPDYSFGWHTITDWLEEEGQRNVGAWHVTREVLSDMTSKMLEDVPLSCRRLALMEASRFSPSEIEGAWRDLLENHPASMQVNCEFFDYLAQQGQLEDAGRVMEEYSRIEPEAVPVLARQACVACWKKDRPRVLELAEKVFADQDGADPYSMRLTFHSVRQVQSGVEGVEMLFRRLRENQRLSPACVEELVGHFAAMHYKKGFLELLELLEPGTRSWDSTDELTRVLERFADCGGASAVVDWAQGREKLCRRVTRIWQAVGYAYTVQERREETRRWLRSWRNREGVEPWTLLNYAATCLELEVYRDGMEACEHALEELPHDDNAPRLVEVWLRSALATGDEELFVRVHERHGSVLARSAGSDSVEMLKYLYELFQASDLRTLRFLHRSSRGVRQNCTWAAPLWRREVSRKLPALERLLFRLGLRGR